MKKELNKKYDPKEIEPELYRFWMINKFFQSKVDNSKKNILF